MDTEGSAHHLVPWIGAAYVLRVRSRRHGVFFRLVARRGRLCATVMSFVFMCAFCMGQDAVSAGTTKFVLDGNRIYARLSFSRPDGSTHKALAFVDMGSKSMALT